MNVVTDSENCIFCNHRPHGVHHLLFGTSARKLCDEDGLYIPICDECHTMGKLEYGYSKDTKIHGNSKAEDLSKMLGQAIYEREQAFNGASRDDARQSFIRRYGRSYL